MFKLFNDVFFFVFGLFWGSFLNNVALRLESGEDFLYSRSKCPACQKNLRWYELIPILSFIIQKGKCRHCSKKISWRYPLIEILTGLWVMLLTKNILGYSLNYFFLVEFIFYFLFLSIIFVLGLYDWRTFLVDDRFVIVGGIVGLIFNIWHKFFNIPYRDFTDLYLLNNYFYSLFFSNSIFDFLISPLLMFFLFLLIYLLSKGQGLGFGDVKIIFVIGLFLRLGDILLMLIVSSFLGFLYGLGIIIKYKNFKQPIPFVPFFFLGIILIIFFGKYLSQFYLNTLHLSL
ncbi:MAG: prepilin peptidase [Candidatus Parcubacteria bacterium]|nr:MAG: prepilin peptidase [Candidatus Parcubacteria bacterium]